MGYTFFFWSISPTNQIWRDSQNFWDLKMLKIFRGPQYFGSPAWSIRNLKKKKKYTPRLGPATYGKNFSSNRWNLWICRGKTLGHFWTLGSPEVHEDEVWQICVYDNFCSTTRGPSTLKVSRIFAQPFLRNAGKGGGPLNRNFIAGYFEIKFRFQIVFHKFIRLSFFSFVV